MKTPDTIAQECAERIDSKVRMFTAHTGALEDFTYLIAAAIREATEPLKLELGALHGRIGLFAAKWYLISDNLPTDETFAQMEEQIADAANKYLALMAERDQLRAALDVAEGALKAYAKYEPFDNNVAQQALDRIAATKNNHD